MAASIMTSRQACKTSGTVSSRKQVTGRQSL
jgi:hypothetical protein